MPRWPIRGVIALLALVLAVAGALYLLRLPLSSRWLEYQLAARGLPGASLRVTRLDTQGVALEQVALGPELGIGGLAFDLDPWDRARPVRRVRVSGARLRLALEPGASLLGSLDAPLRLLLVGTAKESSPEVREPITASLPALEIDDAQILLGPGRVDVALELAEPGEDGASAGELHLVAQGLVWKDLGLESARIELPFALSSSADSVSIAWSERARAELLGVTGLPVSLGGALQATSNRGRVDVQLGDALAVTPQVELVVDLPELDTGDARLAPSRWQVALEGSSVRAQAQALGDRVRADVQATLDPATGAGQARIALAPVEFTPGGLQPVELDARLGSLRAVSGRIAGAAELGWSGGELRSSSAELTLTSLGFRSSSASIEGLRGVIQLSSLAPLASARAQTLDAAALEVAGIRFREPHVRFSLGPERVHLEEARLSLGSGKLRVNDAVLGPSDVAREWTVQAADLELRELLELAHIEGVSGSGTLSGAIPLRLAGDGIEIRDALLESSQPGVLRIRSERVRSALGSAGETVEQLALALEDFHYETLRIELEKPVRGETVARLHLLGNNPAVLEGRAFALNVNLEADLDSLLRAVGRGLELSGSLR